MAKLKLADVAKQCHKPYQEIYLKVVSGLIPAERSENGSRWLIDEIDLPSITALLGQKHKDTAERLRADANSGECTQAE